MARVRTILHPTNFSACSRCAFHRAAALARDHAARLIVLHVTPPVHVYPDVEITPLRPGGYQAALREMLEELHAGGPRIRVEYRLEQGDPDVEICRVAGEDRCDLIVMGTNGRPWLARLLIGSLTERVRRKAPCPVLAVEDFRPPTGPPEIPEATWPEVARSAEASEVTAAGGHRH